MSVDWWVAADRHARGRVIYVSKEALSHPSTGECIAHGWWTVHPTLGVAFYYDPTDRDCDAWPVPQSNPLEASAKVFTERLWPDHETHYIPVAFLSHAKHAMVADKRALAEARK